MSATCVRFVVLHCPRVEQMVMRQLVKHISWTALLDVILPVPTRYLREENQRDSQHLAHPFICYHLLLRRRTVWARMAIYKSARSAWLNMMWGISLPDWNAYANSIRHA